VPRQQEHQDNRDRGELSHQPGQVTQRPGAAGEIVQYPRAVAVRQPAPDGVPVPAKRVRTIQRRWWVGFFRDAPCTTCRAGGAVYSSTRVPSTPRVRVGAVHRPLPSRAVRGADGGPPVSCSASSFGGSAVAGRSGGRACHGASPSPRADLGEPPRCVGSLDLLRLARPRDGPRRIETLRRPRRSSHVTARGARSAGVEVAGPRRVARQPEPDRGDSTPARRSSPLTGSRWSRREAQWIPVPWGNCAH
jgi:hypothetical protein